MRLKNKTILSEDDDDAAAARSKKTAGEKRKTERKRDFCFVSL